MNKPLIRVLAILASVFLFSCSEQSFTDSCCNTEVLVVETPDAYLYVPNAFTPNNDGLNDFLFPAASQGVKEVKYFRILNDKNLIFENKNFLPNQPESGWDGHDPSGKPLEGVFKVEIAIIDKNGKEFEYTSSVCSRTGSTPPCVVHENNCCFSSQHDGAGGLDRNLPSWENCK